MTKEGMKMFSCRFYINDEITMIDNTLYSRHIIVEWKIYLKSTEPILQLNGK